MKRLRALNEPTNSARGETGVAHVETKGRIDAFRGRNDGLRDHLSTEHAARTDRHEQIHGTE